MDRRPPGCCCPTSRCPLAGVPKSTFYDRFTSKEQCFLELLLLPNVSLSASRSSKKHCSLLVNRS
nr:TetR family transcriptional regulator [Mycobacterium tuberculosis]